MIGQVILRKPWTERILRRIACLTLTALLLGACSHSWDACGDVYCIDVVADDAAHNGSRPELVWADGRWLIATADYGRGENELRLYDPDFLFTAASTTDPNVLVMRFPAPPYVHSLHYWAEQDVLEPGAPGELEGLHFLEDNRVLAITSSGANNVYPGRLTLKAAAGSG